MATPYKLMTPEQKRRAHEANKRWKAKNAEIVAERKRRHYYANRDKYLQIERDRVYKKKYGITLAQYDEMLAAQNGKCKICGSDKAGTIGQNFAVDHCHTTGKVRGLLCINCNARLGWYEVYSAKAEEYLREA